MKKLFLLSIVLLLSACGDGKSVASSSASEPMLIGKYVQKTSRFEFTFKPGGRVSFGQSGVVRPGKEDMTYKIEGNKITIDKQDVGVLLLNKDGAIDAYSSESDLHRVPDPKFAYIKK